MRKTLAILLGIVIGSSNLARSEVMEINTSPSGAGSCHIADPGPGGMVTVYVLLKFSPGATAASFSAPMTAGAGLQHINDTSPGFTTIGNSQTELNVFFGTCMTGSWVVAEMNFLRVGVADPCTPYALAPGGTFVDCALVEKTPAIANWTIALNSNGCSQSPYRQPFPANGAANVGSSTSLSWDDPQAIYCFDPIAVSPAQAPGTGQVYFGTTTNPPYHEQATLGHYVGSLSPGTTYYWRINAETPFAGPLWSFTTAQIVATEQSTWGAIKALYR